MRRGGDSAVPDQRNEIIIPGVPEHFSVPVVAAKCFFTFAFAMVA